LPRLLVLGAGYMGAALAGLALGRGDEVVLADNWSATDRAQLDGLAARGARVETADIRRPEDLDRLMAVRPDRVHLLAAQASRPLSWRDPGYTEETNLVGARLVAEAVAAAGGAPLVLASSLQVYGSAPRGRVDADHPYGPQGDLAHLSKVYAELLFDLYARRPPGFALCVLRFGIVYGPSPVMHEAPESVTVVDTFRRRVAAGEPLRLDDGGRATLGVVHVDDAARILLDAPATGTANVAAETVTVAEVAALARGEEASGPAPTCEYVSPFAYRHRVADHLAPSSAGPQA
jgi:nucleoside-diphosphate-sugar epimerase